MRSRGAANIVVAERTAKAAVRPNANHPERAMAIRSRAPKAWPILTVAACPSPSGTMKAREPICSAIVWASSVAGPISPMTSVAAQKTPDLGGDHRADRQAEPPERRELAPVRTPGRREQAEAAHPRVDQRECNEEREHQRLRQRGREARADDSERRHAELAEDEGVIGERVEG